MARGMAGAENDEDLRRARADIEYQQARFEQAKQEAEEQGFEYDEEDDYKRWHGHKDVKGEE
jgi:hypothetical protein